MGTPFREVFAGDENETYDLDGDTGEAEDGLRLDCVKQYYCGDGDEPAGRHKEESSEFH